MDVGSRYCTTLGELELEAPLRGGRAVARCGDRLVELELVDADSAVATAAEVRRRVRAYAALTAAGVRVPRLLDHDVVRGYVVKEHLGGTTVGDTLAGGRLGQGVTAQFDDLMRLLRRQDLAIDWSPANFVVVGGALYYTAYDVAPRKRETVRHDVAAAASPAA